jgi:hypothetical protein
MQNTGHKVNLCNINKRELKIMSNVSDVSDDDSFVDLYAVVEGRARPKRPAKHEATIQEKLPPRRTESRTTLDRASIEICDFDPLAIEEIGRLEKSRKVDAPSRPSRRHSLSAPTVFDEHPHKLFGGSSPALFHESEKQNTGEKSLHRPPPELVDSSHQRRRRSRRQSVGDVVDFGTVARLRELVIGDHDSDDDDALPQKLLLLMKIAQPIKNENSSRHQDIALLEPQRAKSMRNLNKSALSSEQLHREATTPNKTISHCSQPGSSKSTTLAPAVRWRYC